MPSDYDPIDEFTRFRANIQLGDGPDRRGDITVEMVREVGTERPTRSIHTPEAVTDSVPAVDVSAPCNDQQFAEFYHELMRGGSALREALGLNEDDE